MAPLQARMAPKGGWRIGITAPHGGYFYYAHLDSYADVEIGDEVAAGEILGYMGDSGYGEEGTVGNFPVHLHLGVYLEEPKEISINPYWILRYAEDSKLSVEKTVEAWRIFTRYAILTLYAKGENMDYQRHLKKK